ncbi:TonB-dependent receptor [Enterobacter cloacae]|uniref:TonB-dependent receptor n=1 Tax=Enterobacter cloacae TaxID=550 RepID=UPI000B8DB9BB|nr:TonB-dependent receptor [Enterobacter cloacae]ASQ15697.1 putative TonB-dependent receptor [Enterobacter cloacae]
MKKAIKKNRIIAASLVMTTSSAWAVDAVEKSRTEEVITVKATEKKTGTFSSSLLNNREALSGKVLGQVKTNTIGNTVAKMSGVQAEGFGPNAARPVIRSISGNRVGILVNNLPITDVSFISGNMPIPVDMALVNEIEVSKTSEALLYGGSTSGGSVHLWDDRIITTLPEKGVSGHVTVNSSTNNGNGASSNIKFSDGGNWVFNVSGARKQVSEYKIPSRSKASACYNTTLLANSTSLINQCQKDMKIINSLNPAYFPYLSKFWDAYHDDLEYGLAENDKYTSRPMDVVDGHFVNNTPNAAYKPGSPYTIKSVTPEKDNVDLPNRKIQNSFFKSQTGNASLSYIGDDGYLGISATNFETRYGVPGYAYQSTKTSRSRYKAVSVANLTRRIDVQGKYYHRNDYLKHAAFYYAYADSDDKELVGEMTSSKFSTSSHQFALEATHAPLFDRITGVAAVNMNYRDLKTSGYDSYLPSVLTKDYGVYLLESIDLAPFEITGGIRKGRTSHELKIPPNYNSGRGQGAAPEDRAFNTEAYTMGLAWTPYDEWTLKLQKNTSTRAPEINELYTHGPHFAYLIEEQGNKKLKTEKSDSVELTSVLVLGNFTSTLNLYKTDYRDFKLRRLTGINRGGLSVMQWDQTDLETRGAEYELKYRYDLDEFQNVMLALFGDFVKNKSKKELFITGNYLPNLPNEKHGVSVNYKNGDISAFASAIYYKKQKESGNTMFGGDVLFPSYTMIDAGIGKKFHLNNLDVALDFVVNNLTDTQARPAGAQLKYLAPLPGRNYGVNMRVDF